MRTCVARVATPQTARGCRRAARAALPRARQLRACSSARVRVERAGAPAHVALRTTPPGAVGAAWRARGDALGNRGCAGVGRDVGEHVVIVQHSLRAHALPSNLACRRRCALVRCICAPGQTQRLCTWGMRARNQRTRCGATRRCSPAPYWLSNGRDMALERGAEVRRGRLQSGTDLAYDAQL